MSFNDNRDTFINSTAESPMIMKSLKYYSSPIIHLINEGEKFRDSFHQSLGNWNPVKLIMLPIRIILSVNDLSKAN